MAIETDIVQKSNSFMEQQAIDQIHLCINELQMIKQLIDLKAADDFCSRLLGIYAMLRVDDITIIWSHRIPKNVMERHLADGVKNQYNQGLREVRDKLGAHYQSPNEEKNLFGLLRIFKSLDYANIVCLIEAIIEVEEKVEGKPVVADGFTTQDLLRAQKALEDLYSDDQAYLTNGALDLFGINKGGLITCSKPQVKAQDLKSIETMVSAALSLLNNRFDAEEVARMFKRLAVVLIFNYHDNLITRKDIKDSAVQYEEGFDILFKSLITKKDDRELLERSFDEFESIYCVESVINKYRDTRNKACAHFDEASTTDVINKKLDQLDMNELIKAYNNMLNLFNYICRNVFLLKMLSIPARVPVFDSQIIASPQNESFYGDVLDFDFPKELSCTEIMRLIRKKDRRFDEACYSMGKKLASSDDAVYQEMMSLISQRLKTSSISDFEKTAIFNSLYKAKSGFPNRLQKTIYSFLMDELIAQNCQGSLLWLLASICQEDEVIDFPRLFNSIIEQAKAIPTAFSVLALLHIEVEKNRSLVAHKDKAHIVSNEIRRVCDDVKQPIEKCGLMLMLSQHWYWDNDYSLYKNNEIEFSSFFDNELKKAVDGYFSYVKLRENDFREECILFLNTRHYLLLLYRLAFWEELRKQKHNLFLEMWRSNCFVRTRSDIYETIGVGLLSELEGNTDLAKQVFEMLVKENPINKDAIKTLEDYYQRNPAMRNNP